MKKTLILLFLLLLGMLGSKAQQVIASSGEFNTITTGTLSWTLGEVVTETGYRTAGESAITQGFQQGKLNVTAIRETVAHGFRISLSPNPASDLITLSTENFKGLEFHVFDQSGKLMNRGKLSGSNTPINLSNYPSGSYILRITGKEQAIESYQIIKN